jgi:hypothetical protein
MSSDEQPKIQSETSEHFRRIVVGGMFGTVDSIGLQATVYSEYLAIEKALLEPKFRIILLSSWTPHPNRELSHSKALHFKG